MFDKDGEKWMILWAFIVIMIVVIIRTIKKRGKFFRNDPPPSSTGGTVAWSHPCRCVWFIGPEILYRWFHPWALFLPFSDRHRYWLAACLTAPDVRYYPDLGLFSNDGCRRRRCCTKLIKQRYQREKLNQMKESHIMEEWAWHDTPTPM